MRHRLAIVSVGAGLILISGCAGAPTTRVSTAAPHGDLSNREYAAAVELARHEIRQDKATVTSATATVGSGTVTQPNLNGRCESGRLLHIKLIGTFPTIVTTGNPVAAGARSPDFTVHAVVLTADATSGQSCQMGVQTGRPSPEPGAVVLDLG